MPKSKPRKRVVEQKRPIEKDTDALSVGYFLALVRSPDSAGLTSTRYLHGRPDADQIVLKAMGLMTFLASALRASSPEAEATFQHFTSPAFTEDLRRGMEETSR